MSKVSKSKTCTKCKLLKPVSEFQLIKKGTAHRSNCRECGNAMCRAYKAKHRAAISVYNKQYKSENKEDISVYNHNYNKNNRAAIQERQTTYQRERKKVDPEFVIAYKLRNALRRLLKYGSVTEDILDLVGCELDFLYTWFYYQFDAGMDIANHGTLWSTDHVDPCSNYDLLDSVEQKKCFHWSNLRPLIKLKNSKKIDKVDNELIQTHKKKATKFLKFYKTLNLGFDYELQKN